VSGVVGALPDSGQVSVQREPAQTSSVPGVHGAADSRDALTPKSWCTSQAIRSNSR
jgi:hypothetical protein